MPQESDFDRNPALSDNYERAPRWFVPGYDASHAMAAVLLRDRIGERGHILVLGAGAASSCRYLLRNAKTGPLLQSILRSRCFGRRRSNLRPLAHLIGCPVA
jgi:hypothetical protein